MIQPPQCLLERMTEIYGCSAAFSILFSSVAYILLHGKLHLAFVVIGYVHLFILETRYYKNAKALVILDRTSATAYKSMDLSSLMHGGLLEVNCKGSQPILLRFLLYSDYYNFYQALNGGGNVNQISCALLRENPYFSEQFLLSSSSAPQFFHESDGGCYQSCSFYIDSAEFEHMCSFFKGATAQAGLLAYDSKLYYYFKNSAQYESSMETQHWNLDFRQLITTIRAKIQEHVARSGTHTAAIPAANLAASKQYPTYYYLTPEMLAALGKLYPDMASYQLYLLLPSSVGRTLTEQLLYLCDFYRDFRTRCERTVQTALELLSLPADDQEACGFAFITEASQYILNAIRGRMGEVKPVNTQAVAAEPRAPVFEFVYAGIHFSIAVDPRVHSWPSAYRGSFYETKFDIKEALAVQNYLFATYLMLDLDDKDIITPPLCCSVTYAGFTVYCEAKDTRIYEIPQREYQKRRGLQHKYVLVNEPQHLSQSEAKVVYGYTCVNSYFVFAHNASNVQLGAIKATANALNLQRHFLPLLGSELQYNVVDDSAIADYVYSQLFVSWLGDYDGGIANSSLYKFLRLAKIDIMTHFPDMKLKDCVNAAAANYTVVLDSRLALGTTVVLDAWGYLQLYNVHFLCTPDVPSCFLRYFGANLNLSKAYESGILEYLREELQNCRLPLKYTRLLSESCNPDAFAQQIALDERDFKELADVFALHLEQVESGCAKPDFSMINHALLQYYIAFYASTGAMRIVKASDTYRTVYLPLLQQLIDRSVENGAIKLLDIDDLYEHFQVPEYLRVFTACCSQSAEIYEHVLRMQVTKAAVMLLNRALRSLMRLLQQNGYKPEYEALICQELQLVDEQHEYAVGYSFYLVKNTKKRIESVHLLLKKQVLYLYNAFFGFTPQKLLFKKISTVFTKYYHYHSFAEYYLKQLGIKHRIPTVIEQETILSNARDKSWYFSCFQRLLNCVMIDKTYDFSQKAPFNLHDIVELSPTVKQPVHWVLSLIDVPHKRWRATAQKIEDQIQIYFSQRVFTPASITLQPELLENDSAASETNAREVFDAPPKTLLYNMHFQQPAYNCRYADLFIDLARTTRYANHCVPALVLSQRYDPSAIWIYQQLSSLHDDVWKTYTVRGAFENSLQAADAANQLAMRYFNRKSQSYMLFTALQCMRLNIPIAQIDNTLIKSTEDIIGTSQLAGELSNYEGFCQFNNSMHDIAMQYLDKAVYIQRNVRDEREKILTGLVEIETYLKQQGQSNLTGGIQNDSRSGFPPCAGTNAIQRYDIIKSSSISDSKEQCAKVLCASEALMPSKTLINYAAHLCYLIHNIVITPQNVTAWETNALAHIPESIYVKAQQNMLILLRNKIQLLTSQYQQSYLLLSTYLANLVIVKQRMRQETGYLIEEAIYSRSFLGQDAVQTRELFYLLGCEQRLHKYYDQAACSFDVAIGSTNSHFCRFYLLKTSDERSMRLLIENCVDEAAKTCKSIILAAEKADTPIPAQVSERLRYRLYTSENRIREVRQIISKCCDTQEKTDWWDCIALIRMRE